MNLRIAEDRKLEGPSEYDGSAGELPGDYFPLALPNKVTLWNGLQGPKLAPPELLLS